MAVVGVTPPIELVSRPRLFEALTKALDVRFEARDTGELRGLDALVAFADQSATEVSTIPTLELESAGLAPGRTRVSFAATGAPHRAFDGRKFVEEHEIVGGLTARPGEQVICHSAKPLWVSGNSAGSLFFRAACAPVEIDAGQSLRDHLRSTCFISHLPLFHFLGELTRDDGFGAPGLRAAFLFDDPNLHWRSYGFVDYRAIASSAEEAGYHVAFATIPLDAWLVSRQAAQVFRRHPQRLSLLFHGNNHFHEELAQPSSVQEGRVIAAQALRRIALLERRAGVSVARVMAPPHGACSLPMMTALHETGFQAICIGRSRPWLGPTKKHLLEECDVVEFVGGLPAILRTPLSHPWEELCFHALLGQPLILYGHHDALAAGDAVLTRAATFIDSFGSVRWLPLDAIARTNASVRRVGTTAVVRPNSRIAEIDLEAWVEDVRVLPPPQPGWQARRIRFRASDGASEELEPAAHWQARGASKVSIEIVLDAVESEGRKPSRRMTAVAAARRLATETRDRAAPLVRRGSQDRRRTVVVPSVSGGPRQPDSRGDERTQPYPR
jgi:hypothetical protein